MVLDKTQKRTVMKMFGGLYEEHVETEDNIDGNWITHKGNSIDNGSITYINNHTGKNIIFTPNEKDFEGNGIRDVKEFVMEAMSCEILLDGIHILLNGTNIMENDDIKIKDVGNIFSIHTHDNSVVYTTPIKNTFKCNIREDLFAFDWWVDTVLFEELQKAIIKFLSIYNIVNKKE